MLWESGSNDQDSSKGDTRSVHNNTLPSVITPVLVPAHSGSRLTQQTVPIVVPDVEELKEQFQQQQYMLAQIKESIKENESQLSSKEKKVEAYANRLSQIRARAKTTDIKHAGISQASTIPSASGSLKSPTKKPKESDVSETDKSSATKVKLSPKGKIGELKKRLQESKIKFEERTDKEVSHTKKIESIVENLRVQLEERDITIQELQKIVEQPVTPVIKSELASKRNKANERANISKSTQTTKIPQSDDSIEIITLQNRIHELEATKLDLEERLKEKEAVIEARTQAVTLLSQDLSIKGKNTLECLEETRQEMRSMQNNFIVIENQLKKELLEKDDRLIFNERKLMNLEDINSELNLKNVELQEKLTSMEKKFIELDLQKQSSNDRPVEVQNDDKVAELNKNIELLNKELDDSNKLMIKMKLEHKNKIKNLNKTIEKLKETSDDKAEILRLENKIHEFELLRESWQNKIAELEEEKGNLLLSILDVDDFKVMEKNMKEKIKELETLIKQQSDDTEKHLKTISSLDKEKQDLFQSSQDQNILIENLYAKIQNLESENLLNEEKDAKIKELCAKLNILEDEYKIKLEIVKSEHCKEMEMLESYYNVKLGSTDKKNLEEYRISSELNNVQVEEQIEILIREKQQLLEKLKNLSGVSTTESFTFEAVDRSELQSEPELKNLLFNSSDDPVVQASEIDKTKSRELYLQKVTNEQQIMINDLKNAVINAEEKVAEYQKKISILEESIKNLEEVNKLQSQMESSDYNESLKNQKSSSNVKNKIKKIQLELTESKNTIKEQNEKLEELNMKLEEKEQIIKNYIEKIELFEKDDWGRENDWKSTQDEFENLQELQKKCLSLETSLIELTDDCERLRKENIEIVHLLSEEKVKRKKLLEKLQAKEENEKDNENIDQIYINLSSEIIEENADMLTDSQELKDQNPEWDVYLLEQRILQLVRSAEKMNEKLKSVEMMQSNQVNISCEISKAEAAVKDLQEKLEWSNIVLTSKETEIFRLQNLLEDSSKVTEYLEKDLKETTEKLMEKNQKLNDLMDELHNRETQIEELTINFRKLQENFNIENQRTASNESQLRILMSTVKEMESDAAKKENELKEIRDIFAEKNLDIHNLREWLEQVNNDLACSYKEHLENLEKCLRDKELEYDKLVQEKNALKEAERNLISANEDAVNQRAELLLRIDTLQETVVEKENIIQDLNQKLNDLAVKQEVCEKQKDKEQEIEELKTKIKKLAGNLKKKVQNEKDLLQQIKEYEEFVAGKESILEKFQNDLANVNEKWLTEKSEKEQFKNELAAVLLQKSNSETENADLKEKLKIIEIEYNNKSQKNEYKLQQMEIQLQKMYENSEVMKLRHEQDKEVIANLETELSNLSQKYENDIKCFVLEADKNKKENESLRKQFTEVSNEYEKLIQENTKLQAKCNELQDESEKLQRIFQNSLSDNSYYRTKTQEQLAVIESLEEEIRQTRDNLKRNEDKLCFLEERRSSLENKNEEMLETIERESKKSLLIDDMSNKIKSLMDVEENLKFSLKSLNHKNQQMEEKFHELNAEKTTLEEALKESKEKSKFLSGELEKLRDENSEKNAMLEFLKDELEKSKSLKMQNKQKTAEVERLNKDIQMLEADLKESIENSKTVEKSLNCKIEELLRENAILSEKNISLIEEKEQREDNNKTIKRKKSVTFRTDETDYIRDLKKKIREYSESLKKSNSEIESLKMHLLRETLRNEVTEVVSEAKEKIENLKSSPEKVLKSEVGVQSVESHVEERTFDGEAFFVNVDGPDGSLTFDQEADGQSDAVQESSDQGNIDYDSLVWDDGWGTDGHLEEHYLSTKDLKAYATDVQNDEYRKKCEILENEIKIVQAEKIKLEEELQSIQTKYAKAIKKIKEQKAAFDKLQSEVKCLKMNAEFGSLDDAMLDELKSQINAYEQREKELLKNLDNFKIEKEGLLKRIEVLNAGNEKFVEMKERQDSEMEIWEIKNRELLKEIAELKNQLRDKANVTVDADMNDVLIENRELKNRIEALEWEICELKELEEKHKLLEIGNQIIPADVEKIAEEKSHLLSQVAELNNLKEMLEKKLIDEEKKNFEVVGELKQQVTALATENETLQEILGKIKESKTNNQIKIDSSSQPTDSSVNTGTKIFDYFQSMPANDVFSSAFAQPVHSDFKPTNEIPVVEPVIERRIVKEITEGRSDEKLEKELEQLKQENELLKQQLNETQLLISSIQNEKDKMIEMCRAEYESTISYNLKENNNAFKKINELEQMLALKVEELNSMTTKVKNLEDSIATKEEEINYAIQGRQTLEKALEVKAEEVKNIWIKAQELDETLQKKTEEHKNCNLKIHELEKALEINASKINELTRTLADLQEMMDTKEREMNESSVMISKLQQALNLKAEELNKLELRNRDLEGEINVKNASIENMEKINANLLSAQQNATESSIPLWSEIEALNSSLDNEKLTTEYLRKIIAEKENVLQSQTEEVQCLKLQLAEANRKLEDTVQEYERQKSLAEEYCDAKEKIEDIISNLQTELETVNLELNLSRKEVEEIRRTKQEIVADLESRINSMEEMKSQSEENLKKEIGLKTANYEQLLIEKENQEVQHREEIIKLQSASKAMETVIDTLKSELKVKEIDIFELSEALSKEQKQSEEIRVLLQEKENEIADLKQALTNFQEEISSFRNFEKQVKELRMAQINQGSEVQVPTESDPDFTSWTEHELVELNTRLQSDLDTALYMLHQRDIRCDELTFELMQLLEERDTLQLRLSTAIRINEELRSQVSHEKVSFVPDTRQDKDLMDQSNDRQTLKNSIIPEENLRELAQKISQLHSVGYIRDKTIQDETMQRHRDQMALFGRISDADTSIGRESHNSPAAATNWIRTKTAPKVMHI